MPLFSSSLDRRAFLTSTAAAGLALATGAQADDAWPSHPVRMIVPYPPGGSTDVLTRILMDRFKDMLGQNFVVENRSGAGGNIGMAVVSGCPVDGYTMCAETSGHFAISQYLFKSMPFDAE